jgi:dTDP-4-amino-4,6-dideoxygalactose transaminase
VDQQRAGAAQPRLPASRARAPARGEAIAGPLTKAARLATGDFTPSLSATWGEREHAVAARWLEEGAADAAAPDALVARLVSDSGAVGGRGANLGRTALELVLRALGLPDGAEVAITSYSCSGVVTPVLRASLRPVLVDVDAELNMSAESLAAVAGPELRAVVLPHLAGVRSADGAAIAAWAAERGIAVVEDVAQAQGLERRSADVGRLGVAAIYSFGGGKMLFGPGGGAAVAHDPGLAERLRAASLPDEDRAAVTSRVARFRRRWTASRRVRARRELSSIAARRLGRRDAVAPPGDDRPGGYEAYELAAVEAGLALAQLDRLDELIDARRRHAGWWHELLDDRRGVRAAPLGDSVAAKLWVVFEGGGAEERAERARVELHRGGVETETLYVPLHRRAPFAHLRTAALDRTDEIWRNVVCLPNGPELTGADARRFRRVARRAFG